MIVVTTPTGLIGKLVVDHLLKSDVPIRLIVRDSSRLAPQVRDRVEVVEGSHKDLDVVTRAFTGADAVFWITPPNLRAVSVDAAFVDFTRPACEAIKAQGVKRVVGVTVLGRGHPMVDHAGIITGSLKMDDLIAAAGVAYRALMLPAFMDNMLRQTETIRRRGMFFSPLDGDLKMPACATQDIASVAAQLLLDLSWSGQDHVPLLGPEDLSFNDMASTMSDVLGQPIHFQQISIETYKQQILKSGASEAMTQGLVDTMVAKAQGVGIANIAPRTAASSTPTSFRQWCEEVLTSAIHGSATPKAHPAIPI
jgi:uncharacterized protein YbjT (DUF2867 family)